MLRGQAIQKMRLRSRFRIVNLRDASDSFAFLANIDAVQGLDYQVSRSWAHYVRWAIPGTSALRYTPHRLGAVRGGSYALVLFRERGGRNPRPSVYPLGDPIRLADRRGKKLIVKAMRPLRVTFS
jgi:hypothetical protein